jgi:DNA polymerase elongation subunit (family B)
MAGPKVVFDIETIGINFDEDLDDGQREYLLKYAKDEDEIRAIKEGLGLHAPTGRVVTIALYNPDSKKARVYFQTGSEETIEKEDGDTIYKSGSEKEILEWFWQDIKKYRTYITFNGRCFDIPFLRIRSAILGIKCSIELMTPRYDKNTHIDLLEELMFQGALNRKFTLDFYCKAFSIKSPKGSMSGYEVPKYFKEGKGLQIAEYCLGDVIATGELYQKWYSSYNKD